MFCKGYGLVAETCPNPSQCHCKLAEYGRDSAEDRVTQEQIRSRACRSLAVLEKSFLRISGHYVKLNW
jgi:hypothetical protein